MSDMELMLKAERESLLSFLQGVEGEQWNVMTACEPWTVRHLTVHLTGLGRETFPKFAMGLVSNGFNLEQYLRTTIDALNVGTDDEVLANYAATVKNPSNFPGKNKIALGEYMVHGEDIRRALGSKGEHPASHIPALGDLYAAAGGPVQGKRRSAGLRLNATDADWTHGDGPEITGPGMDLIMGITGRFGALDTCSGEGLETLKGRP
jgi:uncharacterized protein (TIGR03083 family)